MTMPDSQRYSGRQCRLSRFKVLDYDYSNIFSLSKVQRLIGYSIENILKCKILDLNLINGYFMNGVCNDKTLN